MYQVEMVVVFGHLTQSRKITPMTIGMMQPTLTLNSNLDYIQNWILVMYQTIFDATHFCQVG